MEEGSASLSVVPQFPDLPGAAQLSAHLLATALDPKQLFVSRITAGWELDVSIHCWQIGVCIVLFAPS